MIRSQIGMNEYIEYMKMKYEKQNTLMKKIQEERQKELGKTEKMENNKSSLKSDLPDYFRWSGDETTLLEDPNISGGWKIKLELRKGGGHRMYFVTPDRKYVIRSIEGVLEYLQHNDVQHGGDIVKTQTQPSAQFN